jgi:ribosome-associated protein
MPRESDGGSKSDPVKSRSQIKREMIQLQKTGERLVTLSRDQIRVINMPDDLKDAVLAAKNIKTHGARKRQLQFIGSLMRKIDVEPIKSALYDIDRGRNIEISEFHKIEKWRDDLVKGIDAPLDEILERFPDADLHKLRNMTNTARKELNEGTPPKSSRALFRYIKNLVKTETQ